MTARTSDKARVEIIAALNLGLTIAATAQKCSVGVSTVKEIKAEAKAAGKLNAAPQLSPLPALAIPPPMPPTPMPQVAREAEIIAGDVKRRIADELHAAYSALLPRAVRRMTDALEPFPRETYTEVDEATGERKRKSRLARGASMPRIDTSAAEFVLEKMEKMVMAAEIGADKTHLLPTTFEIIEKDAARPPAPEQQESAA